MDKRSGLGNYERKEMFVENCRKKRSGSQPLSMKQWLRQSWLLAFTMESAVRTKATLHRTEEAM